MSYPGNEREFHKQVAEHILFTHKLFNYTPTPEQVYDFADSLYHCSFQELIDKEHLKQYEYPKSTHIPSEVRTEATLPG